MWASVPIAPPDPVAEAAARYAADPSPSKMDLAGGVYRDDEGKPHVPPVVARTELQLVQKRLDKEYLPIDGAPGFRDSAAQLLFGAEAAAIAAKRVATCQGLSGTGCLRVAAEYYKKWAPQGAATPVYVSSPARAAHRAAFTAARFDHLHTYRYYDAATGGVDFAGLKEDLSAAPAGAIVVLQLCGHDPTGADLNRSQWAELVPIIRSHLTEQKLIVLCDAVYQGLASGDPDADAYGARLFEREGLEFAAVQSFSHNFGLYGERVGCLSFVAASAEAAVCINGQLKAIVRPMYSNPPVYGARIVEAVLQDAALAAEWRAALQAMAERIGCARQRLCAELQSAGCAGDWAPLARQTGMFSVAPLTEAQCAALEGRHHVYVLPGGRLNVAMLSAGDVAALARALKDVAAGASG